MKSNQEFCFTHSSGEDIYLFSLRNELGTIARISNYGGILQSFIIHTIDGPADLVLGFDTMKGYVDPNYLHQYSWFGAAVGRYGNRIKNAQFNIDGITHQLNANNNGNHLHGGTIGFDKKIWTLELLTNYKVVLQYRSPDGEEGYPGTLVVTLSFELSEDNTLSYFYEAVCDQATAINLTHHSYFNLDNKQNDITTTEMKIDADKVLEQDDAFVTTGRVNDVKDTPYDFTNWKRVDTDWDPMSGYDQSFVVTKNYNELSRMAAARSSTSSLQMEVWSTAPVVHFYTGRWIPKITGKSGKQYDAYSGFCLETQVHPNAINIRSFPNTILRPGETYYQRTEYRIQLLK